MNTSFPQLSVRHKALAGGGERAADHIRLHSDQPGAARSCWVFLVRPVRSLDLPLGLCYLPTT